MAQSREVICSRSYIYIYIFTHTHTQTYTHIYMRDFTGESVGKEFTCNAGQPGLISGLGRFPGEGNGNPLSILAWEIPWTEDPDRLQSMRS